MQAVINVESDYDLKNIVCLYLKLLNACNNRQFLPFDNINLYLEIYIDAYRENIYICIINQSI